MKSRHNQLVTPNSVSKAGLSPSSAPDDDYSPPKTFNQKLQSYLKSLAFVIVAVALFHHLALYDHIMDHGGPLHRMSFNLGLIATAGYVSLFAYIVFVLHWRRNIPIEYSHLQLHAPKVIPITTVLIMISGLLLTRAFWPVLTWKTIPVMFVEFMGFVALLSLLG